jgi:hypothetical protein
MARENSFDEMRQQLNGGLPRALGGGGHCNRNRFAPIGSRGVTVIPQHLLGVGELVRTGQPWPRSFGCSE